MVALIVLLAVAALVLLVVARTIRIVPQARAGVIERFGRYQRTLSPGLALVVPFVDRLRPLLDLREQVVSFPPQPVITEDNLVVNIDTVIYFQVTDAKAATYEIANYIQAIEQLTVTTLRNVIGGIALEGGRGRMLGAFTGVVGDGGVTINERAPIPVTTGNSLTIAAGVRSLLRGAAEMEIEPRDATAVVIGATGSIGGACAQLLAPSVGRLAAHDLVEQACREAARSGRALRAVLLDDPAIGGRLTAAQIDRLLQPAAGAVGASDAWIDRVLAAVETDHDKRG